MPTSGTYAGLNQSCSGAASSTTLTVGGTWTATDYIMIHQSNGAGAGNWELNQIVSDNGTTLTLQYPLSYTYGTSAQAIEVKEYIGGTISGTLTCNTWNQSIGGILPILANGAVAITGAVDVLYKGFIGGSVTIGVVGGNADSGKRGESPTHPPDTDGKTSAGAGGGSSPNGEPSCGSGGGGHGTAGVDGVYWPATSCEGLGGHTLGNSTLTSMNFGAGGGGAGGQNNDNDGPHNSGGGGDGGVIVLIMCHELTTTSGLVRANGQTGIAAQACSAEGAGGGGGGAGGSVLIKATKATIGTNTVQATYGNGGADSGTGANRNGGRGGNGRIRLECCELSGTTNPSASESLGNHDWCTTYGGIM